MKFSQRAPLGITAYTGSAIKYMSDVQYWARKVLLDCKEAFMDSQAEIEADDQELEDDNDGAA